MAVVNCVNFTEMLKKITHQTSALPNIYYSIFIIETVENGKL